MDRPSYSFNFTQSGENMIVDACVPYAVGFKIAQLIHEHSAAAKTKATKLLSKGAPNGAKRRTGKAST